MSILVSEDVRTEKISDHSIKMCETRHHPNDNILCFVYKPFDLRLHPQFWPMIPLIIRMTSSSEVTDTANTRNRTSRLIHESLVKLTSVEDVVESSEHSVSVCLDRGKDFLLSGDKSLVDSYTSFLFLRGPLPVLPIKIWFLTWAGSSYWCRSCGSVVARFS